MREIEKRTFQHNGRTFASKLYETNRGYSVVVFLDDIPVSPSYRVDFETNADYFMQHRQRLTEHLLDLSESDVRQELYFHPPGK